MIFLAIISVAAHLGDLQKSPKRDQRRPSLKLKETKRRPFTRKKETFRFSMRSFDKMEEKSEEYVHCKYYQY